MNRSQCKKYINKAFKNITEQNKTISVENLEIEMKKEIKKDTEDYIDCAKIALNNLLHSGNKITAKDISSQIDVILKLYDKRQIILKANTL